MGAGREREPYRERKLNKIFVNYKEPNERDDFSHWEAHTTYKG